MAQRPHKRSLLKRLTAGLMWPVRSLVAAVAELYDGAKEFVGGLFRPLLGGRRNRDFDRAGRPESNRGRRRASTTAFRRGERDRQQEIRDAERERKRLTRSATEEAAEYREEVSNRAVNCSRGDVVSHLARVNAQKRQKSSPKNDDSKNDDSKNDDSKE